MDLATGGLDRTTHATIAAMSILFALPGTGRARRATAWLFRAGFECIFRLAHEPGRLPLRHLVKIPSPLRAWPHSSRAQGAAHPAAVPRFQGRKLAGSSGQLLLENASDQAK